MKLNLELTRVPQENNNTLSHTVVSKAPVSSNIISTTTGTNNAGSGNQIRRYAFSIRFFFNLNVLILIQTKSINRFIIIHYQKCILIFFGVKETFCDTT